MNHPPKPLEPRADPIGSNSYWVRLRSALKTFGSLVREFYVAPHRGVVARAKRDEDDMFMLLVFAEVMGVPNPASFYTLELQPVLMERFHEWHIRMGMEHSPLDSFKCC